MKNSELTYTDHLETLATVIIYLGTRPKEKDDITAPEIIEHLGIDKKEVTDVLNSFKSIFRKSEVPQPAAGHEPAFRYSLQRRYARRIYEKRKLIQRSEPLSNDEISSLLNYVENRVKAELESKSQRKQLRVTMFAAIVAAIASLVSALLR